MRQLLNSVLKATPALQAVVERRIYAASALGRGDIPADPKKPFIVFREFDLTVANVAKDTSPNVCRKVYNFYIHDDRGSYTRIDQIVSVLRDTVRELTTQVSPSGARCMDAEWNGVSGDTEDPTYDSNLRIVTFTLVSNQ